MTERATRILSHARFMLPALLFSVLLAPASVAKDRPNILVVISDDAGFADFGFQGSKKIPTPNLDALAARGVVFRNAYAGSVCSPSRAMLTTGMYTSRIGYSNNIPSDAGCETPITSAEHVFGLPTSVVTVWERMQALGYSTAAVGKWHIGAHANGRRNGKTVLGNRPQNQGVEYFAGLIGGSRDYWVGNAKGQKELVLIRSDGKGGVLSSGSLEQKHKGEYVTDTLTTLTIDYIRENANGDKPFFMYCSHTAPHVPMQATNADLAHIDKTGAGLKGKRRVQAAMQYALDRGVGRLLAALDDPNGDGDTADSIRDKTLIIFVNDNGGDSSDANPNYSSNFPLRHGKGSQWEGGIRVPMILAGAGVDKAYQDEDVDFFEPQAHVIDILPTAVAAGGGMIGKGDIVDGVNLLPFINGNAQGVPHESLYLRRFSGGQSAVRVGDYKLMYRPRDGFLLFDLKNDPGEKDNLASKDRERVEKLKRVMTDYDVMMEKPRHDNNAPRVSAFNDFRFREGKFDRAKWSEDEAWIDSDKPVIAKLTPMDSTANTVLIFRNREVKGYTSTNDMTRVGGLDFLANGIRFVSRAEPLKGAGVAKVTGRPVLLAKNLKGRPPHIGLYASKPGPHVYTYDLALDVKLYDDLLINGDGNQSFILSGNLLEYRAGRSLKKTGQSTLTLQGESDLTGTIKVEQGKLLSRNGQSLGRADLEVGRRGVLAADHPIELWSVQTLSGLGVIAADVKSEGRLITEAADTPLRIQGSLELTDQSHVIARLGDTSQTNLRVGKALRLAGRLTIDASACSVKIGDRFVLMQAIEREGAFEQVAGLRLNHNEQWVLVYQDESLVAEAVLAGDLDGDQSVDQADVFALLARIGCRVPAGSAGDWDGDGRIGLADLRITFEQISLKARTGQ